MYYIILKKKEGTYLLDKSQDVIWEGPDILGNYIGDGRDHAWYMWNDVKCKSSSKSDGNLYFVHLNDSDMSNKRFLTVLEQF